jgi:hypothetical protein
MIKETILISTLALFGLSGCASFMPEATKYSTEPVERPLLVLPESEIINMKDVDYIVVTRENVEEVWAELEASGMNDAQPLNPKSANVLISIVSLIMVLVPYN